MGLFILVTSILASGLAWGQSVKQEPQRKVVTWAQAKVSSSYVVRGTTITKGASMQTSLWTYFPSGFGIGVFGNMPIEEQPQDPGFTQDQNTFSKVDIFAKYGTYFSEKLKADFYYGQYYYPQFEFVDETMQDAIAKLSYKGTGNPFLSVAYGLAGIIERDIYAEFGGKENIWRISPAISLEAGALVAYKDPGTKGAKAGFSSAQLDTTLSYGSVSIGISQLFETDKEVQNLRTATQTIGSVSFQQLF